MNAEKTRSSDVAAEIALRLYVAGGTPSSRRADANLKRAIGDLGQDVPFEIIDVMTDARRAMSDDIIVTPTLVGSTGRLRMVIVGDLADETKLRTFLSSLTSRD